LGRLHDKEGFKGHPPFLLQQSRFSCQLV